MSWSEAVAEGADCLLECLRKVRLEQFAGNFATRGVTDCARLAGLERQQFATYGVTTPSDVRRLIRLISVIRDLRAEGVVCRHGTDKPAAGLSRRANSDFCTPVVQRSQKNQSADRRAANSASMLSARRRPGSRDAGQRPRARSDRVKRSAASRDPLVLADGVQYDISPTSFSPISQRVVSPLPTHVEKVSHTSGYNYGVPRQRSSPRAHHSASLCPSVARSSRIRVCVRKRPRTPAELKHGDPDIVTVCSPGRVIVNELKSAIDLSKYLQKHTFVFDDAFDETTDNEQVYERTVKPLVLRLFERVSAVCFAFGQTGAGKTHTLLGNKSVPGLYELAASDLFALADVSSLDVVASYYEIYCGQLYDLLAKRARLDVRENGRRKICVRGLLENKVYDAKSLVQLVQYGNLYRRRGSTAVNANSSRSHAVLQIDLRHKLNQAAKLARLTFIDLAGSERAADADCSNRQTRIEGAEINQSLLALKECIRSIDQETYHTPYRQSKLTQVLRESFVGDSQTIMIANISPAHSACDNTLNTLHYAHRVKELNTDAARRSLKHAVIASSTPLISPGTAAAAAAAGIDDSCHASVTPHPWSPRSTPRCNTSSKYLVDNDVLPSSPYHRGLSCSDMTTQRLGEILACCSPRRETPSREHAACDHQTVLDLACSDAHLSAAGAYFLPFADATARSPRTHSTMVRSTARPARRTSRLGDIDETLRSENETTGTPVCQPTQRPSVTAAWPSDDDAVDDDDDDDVAEKLQERDVGENEVQTSVVELKHQSTRPLNSDPSVSLDRRPRVQCASPVAAGGVQSEFVLSTTRPAAAAATAPPPCDPPREIVGKMRTEGESRSSGGVLCCPLSSTVCSRVVDADAPGDGCRQDKRSSKLKEVLTGGGVRNECVVGMNSGGDINVTCCRVDEQVGPQDRSRSGSAANDAAAAEGSGTSLRRSSGRSQTQTATGSGHGSGSSVREPPHGEDDRPPTPQPHDAKLNGQDQRQSQSLQAATGAQPAVGHGDRSSSDWETSPETVKLLAQLINKISELATRQDQMERNTRNKPPCGQRAIANKSSQTDTALKEGSAGDARMHKVAPPEFSSSFTRAIDHLRDSLDAPAVSRKDEKSSMLPSHSQTKNKQRAASTDKSPAKCTPKQTPIGSSDRRQQSRISNSAAPEAEAKRGSIQTTPPRRNDHAIEPTKLTSGSGTQQASDDPLTKLSKTSPAVGPEDIDVAVMEQEQRPPLAAITDNIIHIVRGSSALEDMSVDELFGQYITSEQTAAAAAQRHEPEAYRKPMHDAQSPRRTDRPPVDTGSPQRQPSADLRSTSHSHPPPVPPPPPPARRSTTAPQDEASSASAQSPSATRPPSSSEHHLASSARDVSGADELHRRTTTSQHQQQQQQRASSSSARDDCAKLRMQNRLVSLHEDQLTTMCRLCNQEVCLLNEFKCNNMTFEDYVDRINLLLMSKSTAVDKLMRKIVKIQQLHNNAPRTD